MKKVKKKLQAGGSWRAWVRTHSLGAKGSANLKQLARRYRQAQAEGSQEFQEAAELGKVAAVAAKMAPLGAVRRGAVFGLKTRRIGVMQWRAQCSSFYKKVAQWPAIEQAKACLAEGQGSGALQTALRLARAVLRLEGRKHSTRQQEEVETLRKFADGSGEEAATRIKEVLPVLRRHSLRAVPQGGLHFFELLPDLGLTAAEKVASWASSTRSSNFGPALDKLWGDLHQTIDEGLSVPEGGEQEEVKFKPSRCQEAGLCLCTGRGLSLFRCRNQMLRALKTHFVTKTEKAALSSGCVVLQLQSFLEANLSEAVDAPAEPAGELWLHIGSHSWSPYRPTFQLMVLTDADEMAFHPDLIYLEVLFLHHCLNVWLDFPLILQRVTLG